MSDGLFGLRWHVVDPDAQRLVDAWWRDERAANPCAGARTLRDNARRRIVRIDGAALAVVVKQFRIGSGPHRLRDTWKRRIGRDAAAREACALARASRAGVRVPSMRGLATTHDGDRLLVLEAIEGLPLPDALQTPPRARRALLIALGDALAALHATGLAHGDLQHGNLLVAADGVVLLDLQHARRASEVARMRDLGFLEHSLRGLVPLADRVRVLRRALGIARQTRGAQERSTLRRALAAGEARADEHARSRTRRALRPGRAFAAFGCDGAGGLCVRDFDAAQAQSALRTHDALMAGLASDARLRGEVLKRDTRSSVSRIALDGRSVVVKQVHARDALRPFADLLRGAPAFRAWRGGHGLLARGIGTARPLAFAVRRRMGLPIASWLVLEDLRGDLPADVAAAHPTLGRLGDPDTIVETLGRLVTRLHRAHVEHGDLKASHVWLRPGAHAIDARLLDLEGVRFPARLSEATRRRALAQLNASLPDAFSAAARRRAFARYLRACPFSEDGARSLRRVAEESLARRHRWSGAGCVITSPRS